MSVEATIPGDPELVVQDHGGAGDRSVLLLHGFGGNALHWAEFAPLLTPYARVLAVDLRCHGRSGDGPWDWEMLLADIERVVAHRELDRPAMVGHSLGGGLAASWAGRHPACPGAVNLDGIRAVETALDNYVGLAADTARRQRTELTAMFDAQAETLAAPLTDEQYEAMREQHRQGGPAQLEMFERNIRIQDGARQLRPNAATLWAFREQARRWADDELFDIFDVLAEARCPLLVCVATRSLPDTEQFAELLAAYRRGVERDLAAAEQQNPLLRVVRPDASHAMVSEQPDELANLVRDFLVGS